jgi:hypothetical protein
MSRRRRLGLRPERPPSGARLTMTAPAWVMRKPDWNRLGNEVVRRLGTKGRLRRWGRLQAVFRTDAAAWPHCAAALTCRRRGRRARLYRRFCARSRCGGRVGSCRPLSALTRGGTKSGPEASPTPSRRIRHFRSGCPYAQLIPAVAGNTSGDGGNVSTCAEVPIFQGAKREARDGPPAAAFSARNQSVRGRVHRAPALIARRA